jgi:hypothetical protein
MLPSMSVTVPSFGSVGFSEQEVTVRTIKKTTSKYE